jgi:DNA-binding response OmpR family regulator
VRILRKNGFKAPIIMLTGHDTESDTVLGFESGANDYVNKPFRFTVLLARIRAQLRQYEASEDPTFTIGPRGVGSSDFNWLCVKLSTFAAFALLVTCRRDSHMLYPGFL